MVGERRGRMKNYIYETHCCIQEYAVSEFNHIRPELEKMHNAKIKVVKMYKIFLDYKVKYQLESEE